MLIETHIEPKSTVVDLNSTIDRIFVGQSAKVCFLKEALDKLSRSDAAVLLLGETGSGKDVAAQALHAASGCSGEFVAINCAAIPAELLESELFGHEKGAFTGADRRRLGQFELANDGTIFLDEIGDMPLELQAKLLRVLETQSFRRVGGSTDVSSQFRLIAATHRDLGQLVADGLFREDLMYRIGVFPVKIPPLRERTADIPALIKHMVGLISERSGPVSEPSFTMDAMRVLANYEWPGNVRELRNVVERAVVYFSDTLIDAQQTIENLIETEIPMISDGISSDLETDRGQLPNLAQFRDAMSEDQKLDLRCYLRDIEAILIDDAISVVDGNVSLAAANLGLQRTTLIEKMKKLGITRR